MKIKLINRPSDVKPYDFEVEHDDKIYGVTIYYDGRKFVDDEIWHQGEIIDDEDVRDAILSELDNRWVDLIK